VRAKSSTLLAIVFVAGACGADRDAAPPPPRLPPALAQRLAAEADAVAARLEAGDPCGGAEQAAALQQATIQALNRPGQVPDELKEDLGLAMADLVDRAQTECAAALPPPQTTTTVPDEEEDDDENGRGRGRGKGKKDKGDDD